VRRAPDEPCRIKAIMMIADSGLVWPSHRNETRGGRQLGNVASRMILRAVNPTTSQVVSYLAGLSVAGTAAAANCLLSEWPRLAKRCRGSRGC
jgi:hypothetical protein